MNKITVDIVACMSDAKDAIATVRLLPTDVNYHIKLYKDPTIRSLLKKKVIKFFNKLKRK